MTIVSYEWWEPQCENIELIKTTNNQGEKNVYQDEREQRFYTGGIMIVVAIIGILAAVAVPYYQKYIQKSRLTSMVMPGVHAIETNIASYYSLNRAFPQAPTLTHCLSDANTTYFTPAVASGTAITFTIKRGTVPPVRSMPSARRLWSALLVGNDTARSQVMGTIRGTLATTWGWPDYNNLLKQNTTAQRMPAKCRHSFIIFPTRNGDTAMGAGQVIEREKRFLIFSPFSSF